MAIGSTDVTLTDPTAIGGQGAGGSPTASIADQPFNFAYGTPAGTATGATPPPSTSALDPQLQNIQLSDMSTPNFNIQQPTLMQQAGNFLTNNPWGQLATAAVPLAVGQYGAGQQAQNIQNLTNQMRAQVTPMAQYGQGVLGQMQGGAPVAGPAGQLIGSQLQGAQALSQAAMPYATGQLTRGQQLALQQAAQGAAANTNLAYAMSGNPLSSANIAAQQGIGNQAIIAAGQLQQQNIQFAQQALQSAQSTYNGLLNQSLASAELGLSGFGQAVRQQIASDQAIGAQTGQLFQQIAQGLTANNPNAPGGASAGQQFGSIVQKILSGNQGGAVNQPTSNAVNAPTDSSTMPQYTDLTSNPAFSNAAILGDTGTSTDATFGSGATTPGGGIT